MAITSFEEAAERTWAHVVERAHEELTESSFSMWFGGVRATSLHDGVLEVVAPSDYVRDWLAKHYVGLIQDAAAEAVGLPVTIELGAVPPEEVTPQRDPADPPNTSRSLNVRPSAPGPAVPELHVRDVRRGAVQPLRARRRDGGRRHATVEGVQPAVHLRRRGSGQDPPARRDRTPDVRAVPRLRVKYVTSESFMAEFIKAVRERQGYQFAARYRDIDVLLVDDIQFLAKREETQTEFFHTFNALHQKDRQIVIASDRPPQELGMEERLQSRFRLGLCVDVQPPTSRHASRSCS